MNKSEELKEMYQRSLDEKWYKVREDAKKKKLGDYGCPFCSDVKPNLKDDCSECKINPVICNNLGLGGLYLKFCRCDIGSEEEMEIINQIIALLEEGAK